MKYKLSLYPVLTTALNLAVLTFALFGFIAIPLSVSAQQDPEGCSATGVGLSIGVFRDDTATNPVSDIVETGEVIYYQATLSHLGGDNCNFDSGTLTITTPDNTVTDVTPNEGIPLVSEGNSFVSNLVPYTVNKNDVKNDNQLSATADYFDGLAYSGDPRDEVDASATRNTNFLDIELEVSKTANSAFSRTFEWDIEKSVDINEHDLLDGESGYSQYTIDLTKTTTESNYSVNGIITIYNPAMYTSANITGVSDIINGQTATVDCGDISFPHTLAPDETLNCSYLVEGLSGEEELNTVEVTTDGDVKGNSASATINWTLADVTMIGYDEVTVNDTNTLDDNPWGPYSDTSSFNYSRTFVCEEDEGSNQNTATINETNQSDDALVMVNCLTASAEVEKSGDTLSKVGDDVTYSFTVNNTGDMTLFLDSVIDNVIGDITTNAINAGCDEIASGVSCDFEVTYTIQEGDNDPLINEVIFTYNTLEDLSGHTVSGSDTHQTNLFQPSVSVSKTGPNEGEVGETITYSFTIENTSSNDTPTLILESVSDDVLGNLTGDAMADCDKLSYNESCTFEVNHVLEANPNPLINTVTVLYNPEGFSNDITDSDTHSLDVIVVEEFAGCTPGFWRQSHHFGHWEGYSPDDIFNSVFDTEAYLSTRKGKKSTLTNEFNLKEAVWAKGGGFNALARHSVAALLNATSDGVNYPYTEAEVIGMIQDAVEDGNFNEVKDYFEEANEEGCSIDGQSF